MPWCPRCNTEYEAFVVVCPDCGTDLVSALPDQSNTGTEPVLVLKASTSTEAQVAAATLRAEGIEAVVQPPSSVSPSVGVMGDDVPELEVFVPSSDAARAVEILNSPPLTDAELLANEEESDPGIDAGQVG